MTGYVLYEYKRAFEHNGRVTNTSWLLSNADAAVNAVILDASRSTSGNIPPNTPFRDTDLLLCCCCSVTSSSLVLWPIHLETTPEAREACTCVACPAGQYRYSFLPDIMHHCTDSGYLIFAAQDVTNDDSNQSDLSTDKGHAHADCSFAIPHDGFWSVSEVR